MKGIKPELIDDERGKLFVGGLSWDTTQETLQKYFSRYGEVIDCVVMKNSDSGRSRGFGFITFADPSNVNIVLQNGPHVLDGRTIDPKACTPRSMQKKKGGNFPKVFLGGLPSNVTETDLRTFFGRYGKVMEIVIMYDQEKKKSRGFGFLGFEDEDAVDRCCADHFVNLNGKQVEIKRAEMRDKNNLADFTAAPWNQNPMSVGGIGIGAPNGPPMAGMAPGSMMPGYQGWGSSPAAGYGYAAPTAPGGYQGWGAPATPQAPPQWGSTYSAAQQPGYGSYAPQAGPQAGYGNSWNWSISQNGPVAGQGASQSDMYSRNAGAAPANNLAVPQKNDYAGYNYAGYQTDSATYGGARSYNATDVTPSGIVAGDNADWNENNVYIQPVPMKKPDDKLGPIRSTKSSSTSKSHHPYRRSS
ncbi:heterogeneous nuclear ribonucleoprotein 27C-like isoform X2 [Planococcus citri]|uniref:heterogeneous nuclear ribonucleoprotein 27C-like isoform X2 n=1 Tax=Planococcus citri TaxID=170843 RepID=UPI0031F74AAA